MEQPVLISVLALVILYNNYLYSYLSNQFINLRKDCVFFTLEASMHDIDGLSVIFTEATN